MRPTKAERVWTRCWREPDLNHRSRLVKGLLSADERCRTDKLDGVIKHRSSRKTTMVGRGATLDGRLFRGGTDGSNPTSSSEESATNRAHQDNDPVDHTFSMEHATVWIFIP